MCADRFTYADVPQQDRCHWFVRDSTNTKFDRGFRSKDEASNWIDNFGAWTGVPASWSRCMAMTTTSRSWTVRARSQRYRKDLAPETQGSQDRHTPSRRDFQE